MPGNHDYADRHGAVHALSALGAEYENGSKRIVVDKVTAYSLGPNMTGYFVPYSDDREVLQSAFREQAIKANSAESMTHDQFLFFHCGIQGAKVGADYVMNHASDCTLGDLHTTAYSLAIGGHYHEHQYLTPNTLYVGAMLQHNWGDVGSKRGFLDVHLTDDGWKTTQVETKAPLFVSLDASQLHNPEFAFPPVDSTFLRVTLGDEDHEEEVAKRLNGMYEVCEVVRKDAGNLVASEISVDSARFDPMSVLSDWVATQASDLSEFEQANLLNYGKTLIEKAIQ
jgi:DNA repair exonuclease SbcCD nuclease subunit